MKEEKMPGGKIILLASSGTLEGIEKLVNEYYFSTKAYKVDRESLSIKYMETGKTPKNARVVKRGRRYRFELVFND